MANLDKTRSDPAGQLLDELDDVRAGMLGIEGTSQHMQPMTHFVDRREGCLYFITSRETDLAKSIVHSATAHYCLVSNDHDYHACMSGEISIINDREKLEELWSPMMAAWFEGGQDNPNITMLKMSLNEASVWASTRNALRFGFEMVRSNVNEAHTPDIGEHTIVKFREAS